MANKKPITGHLAEKNGKYHMVINLYDTEGNRKPKWISTGLSITGNKRRAERMLRIELEHYESICVNRWSPDISFADWMRVWLKHADAVIDRPTTLDAYHHRAQRVIDYFDVHSVSLIDMDTRAARNFFDEFLKSGNKKNQTPLSPRTVSDCKSVMNLALDYAIDCKLLSQNPIRHLRVSNIKKSQMQRQVRYFTKIEAEKFIRYCRELDDPLQDIIYVAIVFGLRREECLGLKVNDIDLVHKRLYVRDTVTQADQIYESRGKTKTTESTAVIPLTDAQVEFFQKSIKRREESMKYFGSEWVKSDYLYTRADGVLFRPDYLYHHTKLLLKKFGRPELTFHDFRHTTASILHANGVPIKEAQAYLRHEDPETTLKIYTHFERESVREGLIDLDL